MQIRRNNGVFPAQREDEAEKASREAFDQMNRALGAIMSRIERLEKRPAPSAPPQERKTVQQPLPIHEPKVDLSGLPDPVVDKDGFVAGLAKKLQTEMSTFVATVKDQQNAGAAAAQEAGRVNAKVDKLWKRWTKEHPEFAKAGRLIQAEAAAMVQEGLAEGKTLDDVMFADEDGFMTDLATRVTGVMKEMGVAPIKPKSKAEEAEGVDQGLKAFEDQWKVPAGAKEDDPNLAAGDIGSVTPKRAPKGDDKVIPLTEQMKMIQKEMGIG